MTTVFDLVNSINFSKVDLIKQDPENEKVYVPFVVNRSLSYFKDVIFYVNEINALPNLSKKMQYDYLRISIWKAKRFSKWHKIDNVEDIKVIQEYYQCNPSRAKEYLSILSVEQVEEIKDKFRKGRN